MAKVTPFQRGNAAPGPQVAQPGPTPQPQVPMQIQIDLQDIFVSIHSVMRYAVEIPKERTECDICGKDPFDGSLITNEGIHYYDPEKPLSDILKEGKFQIVSSNMPPDLIVQLAPELQIGTMNFIASLRGALEHAKKDGTHEYPLNENIDFLDQQSKLRPIITLPVYYLIACPKCNGLYIYVGKYEPRFDEVTKMAENINKQVERAMLANGLTMPRQTASGIVLPK